MIVAEKRRPRNDPPNVKCGQIGARSMELFRRLGSEFVGNPVLQYAQSFHVRAPQLRSLLPGKPAWLYFSLNPRRCGITMAVDGRETWNIEPEKLTKNCRPGRNGSALE